MHDYIMQKEERLANSIKRQHGTRRGCDKVKFTRMSLQLIFLDYFFFQMPAMHHSLNFLMIRKDVDGGSADVIRSCDHDDDSDTCVIVVYIFVA
jgi:hypothetical protein